MPSHSFHSWFEGLPERYVVGHRGAAGHRPENTMESFRHAMALGAEAIEFDVHLTKDHQLVVAHDETLERMTHGVGAIRDLPWADINTLDAGYGFTPDAGRTFPWRGKGLGIPLLTEVLDTWPDQRWVAEIKPGDRATAEALAALLAGRDAVHRVLVGSFHDAALKWFRAMAPGYATCAGVVETRRYVLCAHAGWRSASPLPFQGLLVPRRQKRIIPVVTRRTVARARSDGLHVQVWTINDPQEMAELYALGAHAVTTDFPDRARPVIASL